MHRTRIKVCCIESETESAMAVRAGASALGLVSHMPSGPGVIPEARIADIARAAPPAVGTFLLTSAREAGLIVEQQRRCHVNTVQLCDAPDPGVHAVLRDALPGVSLVQVIHVEDSAALDDAKIVASHVDAVLLDSGKPSAAVQELGGTGRVHDWSVSRRIVDALDIPVFLAGGLNAGNVTDAIHEVRPYGVDLCTGVRTDGALDAAKLDRFFSACAAADQSAY